MNERFDDSDCDACGDPAKQKLKGRPLCQECFDELANGIIATPASETCVDTATDLGRGVRNCEVLDRPVREVLEGCDQPDLLDFLKETKQAAQPRKGIEEDEEQLYEQ